MLPTLNSTFLSHFFAFAIAISSLAVWPTIGDSIREPKWITVWISSILFLPLTLSRWKEFPIFLIFPLSYFIFQPIFFAPFSLTYFYLFSFLSCLALGIASLNVPLLERLDPWLKGAVFLHVTLGVLQIFQLDPIFERTGDVKNPNPFVGFFGQTTLLGAYLACLAWYFFAKKERVFWLICTFGSLLTGSAFTLFAWASGFLGLLLWRGYYKTLLFLGLAPISLLPFFYQHDFFSPEGRFIVWRLALAAWLERFWFGWGMDSFSREFHNYHQGNRDRAWLQAHNEPIEILFSGGLVGLVMAALALAYIFVRKKIWWQREDRLPWCLLLLSILANALGNFPLHLAPLALLASIAYFQIIKEK